jgi:hypothetical protein
MARSTSKTTAGTARTAKAPARKAPAIVATIVGLIAERRMARPRGWNRDGLVAFFAGGGWASLPTYDAASLSAEARARGVVTGWIVPAEAFTPGRGIDQSQANSLRAYIRDVVLVAMGLAGAPNVPTIDAVATMLEIRDGEPVVVIYRRGGGDGAKVAARPAPVGATPARKAPARR